MMILTEELGCPEVVLDVSWRLGDGERALQATEAVCCEGVSVGLVLAKDGTKGMPHTWWVFNAETGQKGGISSGIVQAEGPSSQRACGAVRELSRGAVRGGTMGINVVLYEARQAPGKAKHCRNVIPN